MLSFPEVKILLVAINAKYVQTNLAVRLLRSYAEAHAPSIRSGVVSVEIAEWNINQPSGAIVRGIFEAHADAVFFSVYLWNREMTLRVAGDVRRVMPNAVLGFGGPEVSWTAEKFLNECAAGDLVLAGEGEATFAELVERFARYVNASPYEGIRASLTEILSGVAGIYFRERYGAGSEGPIHFGGDRPLIADLDTIPFPYTPERFDFDPAHRIVYYESSRGCPFKCAYCLSSLDARVRYYPLERVLGEIAYFMERGFPLVKFVDRTFNLDPVRFLAIWEFIRDHHNGNTLFHFEIAAEYLPDAAYAVLAAMPEGAVQFEIGIQSANATTLQMVGRPAHPEILAERIARIPKHIHTHVDLIAGLPEEDLASFARSFDFAFGLGADMLQLGFLKVLPGSPMERIAREDEGYQWSDFPPYEVLSSPALPYGDLLILKEVEQLVDTWHNSGLMRNALRSLCATTDSAFALFRALARFAKGYFVDHDLFLPRKPVDAFSCMAAFLNEGQASGCAGLDPPVSANAFRVSLEYLRYDLLLQGKPGVFPAWFERRYSKEAHDALLDSQGILKGQTGSAPVSRRIAYSRTEFDRFRFDESARETTVLFLYSDDKAGKTRAWRFDPVPEDGSSKKGE